MQEWIKCSERMPTENELILTFDKITEQIVIMYLSYHLGIPLFYENNEYQEGEHKTEDIFYWMPLPKLPKDM